MICATSIITLMWKVSECYTCSMFKSKTKHVGIPFIHEWRIHVHNVYDLLYGLYNYSTASVSMYFNDIEMHVVNGTSWFLRLKQRVYDMLQKRNKHPYGKMAL